jgi:Family of unknown function (DUF5640)
MSPAVIRSAVLLPLILLCASPDDASSGQIVGRWRSLEISKGGIGAIYEFQADGVVDFSPGAVVEMPWRIENGQLVLPSGAVGGSGQKLTLKWLGENKVQFVSGNSTGNELTRKGDRSDAANPIIGEWIGTRDMGGRKLEMHWFFYPGGHGLFLLPFETQHGHYTITNRTLHIEMPNTKAQDFKFELKDNALTLFKPEGSGEYRYARY